MSTQRLQQRRAQRKIAILAALALDHADDHPLAVDVAQLQMGHFRAAHAGAVENHQQGAAEQVPAGVDHAGHFFLAQNAGKTLRHSRIRNELAKLSSP